jgi:hypothetical protein
MDVSWDGDLIPLEEAAQRLWDFLGVGVSILAGINSSIHYYRSFFCVLFSALAYLFLIPQGVSALLE